MSFVEVKGDTPPVSELTDDMFNIGLVGVPKVHKRNSEHRDPSSGRKNTVRRTPRNLKEAHLMRLIEGKSEINSSGTFIHVDKTPKNKTGSLVSAVTRRVEVSAEVMNELKDVPYEKVVIEKPPAVRKMIREVVDASLLFTELTDSEKEECVDAFYKTQVKRGCLVIEEGDSGENFYVLGEGTCDALKMKWQPVIGDSAPSKVASYEAGGSFGELALLYHEPRAATIRVTSDLAVLWAIDRKTFKAIHMHFKMQRAQMYESAIRKVPGMVQLRTNELSLLLESVEETSYTKDQVVFKEGNKDGNLYCVIQGDVQFESKATGVTSRGSPGDYYCEKALLENVYKNPGGLKAISNDVVVITLQKKTVDTLLGDFKKLMAKREPNKRPISYYPKRNEAETKHRYHIAMKFEDLNMHLGAVPGTSPSSNKSPNSVVGGNNEETKTKPSPLQRYRSASPHTSTVLRSASPAETNLRPVGKTISSAGLSGSEASNTDSAAGQKQIVLGVGTFGKVILTKHKKTGETYAVKRLNKSWIVENSLEQHVVDERDVMTFTDHPFILKLHNSYWDEYYVYLVLELCLGGELFTYLRKVDKFKEQDAQFFAGSIVLAFEHLHKQSIVYRDLKPENIMLDQNGFVKLVDFGLAKIVRNRTWTLCGTPEYLAPEIVLSKGHNKAVDYWALGVLIFELVAGVVPFQGDDNMKIFNQILRAQTKIKFPAGMTPNCKKIVRDFLHPSMNGRLGNTREGIGAIKAHPWFNSFDFEALLARKLTPPIVPKVRGGEDVSNFEFYPEDDVEVTPELCKWRPKFPYEIYKGETQLVNRVI